MDLSVLPLHVVFGPAAAAVGAAVVLAWRVRETHRPVTLRTIVLPPLAMSTGFAMFAAPAMRVPWNWALGALLAGALLLAGPMSRLSRLERVGETIMMQRSRAFLVLLLVLAGLRIGLHDRLDHLISPLQSAALCYLLAFGMIGGWRVRMLGEFRRLVRPEALSGSPGAVHVRAPGGSG